MECYDILLTYVTNVTKCYLLTLLQKATKCYECYECYDKKIRYRNTITYYMTIRYTEVLRMLR